MADEPEAPRTGFQDGEAVEYRALSATAVLGLILGLLSPLWVADSLMWVVPVPLLGIVISTLALRRIAHNWPDLIGRNAARIGLCLSLIFCVAAPVNWFAYDRMIRHEARQFSRLWLDYLRAGRPELAHQLTLAPERRHPFDDNLLGWYHDLPKMREALENFANERPQLALLRLGDKAQVRYYDTVYHSHSGQTDDLKLLYAITFEQEGLRQSFFMSLRLKRQRSADGRSRWYLASSEGDVVPVELLK